MSVWLFMFNLKFQFDKKVLTILLFLTYTYWIIICLVCECSKTLFNAFLIYYYINDWRSFCVLNLIIPSPVNSHQSPLLEGWSWCSPRFSCCRSLLCSLDFPSNIDHVSNAHFSQNIYFCFYSTMSGKTISFLFKKGNIQIWLERG